MHYIQSHILKVLTYRRFARFKDMKPPRVDSNAYSYHLKAMLSSKYVLKTEDGYTLSAKGMSYVDGLSSDAHSLRRQPKNIAIFALKNNQGAWLMSRRLIQPYIDQYMLPSGKQHFGESPEDHIKRELQEQLGAIPVVRHCGFTDTRIADDGAVITHVTGHVYTGVFDGPLPLPSQKFSYHFLHPNEIATVARTTNIIDAIENMTDPFFLSFDALANNTI